MELRILLNVSSSEISPEKSVGKANELILVVMKSTLIVLIIGSLGAK